MSCNLPDLQVIATLNQLGTRSSYSKLTNTNSGLSVSPRQQVAHQIKWKEDIAGILEHGVLKGQPRAYLFPATSWENNILPEFRQDVLDHIKHHRIQKHLFANHVMSSQVFALNLAAPFMRNPDWLRPIFNESVQEVLDVQAEVTGPHNYFNESGPRGANRTSADLGIWVRLTNGQKMLYLLEVKFTESGFGECGKGRKHAGICDTDGPAIVHSDGALCPLTRPPNNRNYWRLMHDMEIFSPDILDINGSCPLRRGGYQLMRNQLLAASMQADPDCELTQASFALLLHDDNHSTRLLRMPDGTKQQVTQAWPRLLTNPSNFDGIWSPRTWVETFLNHPNLAEWSRQMMERYFPTTGPVSCRKVIPNLLSQGSSPVQTNLNKPILFDKPAPWNIISTTKTGVSNKIVRDGHLRCILWLASDHFAAVKKVYDRVIGEGQIYFRPTDKGVVLIPLDDQAPGFVGFRTSHNDSGYLLKPGTLPPDESILFERHKMFRIWLSTVKRVSDEERAVIRWLKIAQQAQLELPGMNGDWLFLNHEWRFRRPDGTGIKSDVLAVHIPSGRLGIIEVKDSRSKRARAIAQVTEYDQYWQKDAGVLAPFFTLVLQAMGRLYKNNWATTASVSQEPAALFFAYPEFKEMKVEKLKSI